MTARNVVRAIGVTALALAGAASAAAQRGPRGPRTPTAPPEKPRGPVVQVAHQMVVAAAIDTLPKQLKAFYKAHHLEMPSQSLDPEFPQRGPERRFKVDALLRFPFTDLPRTEAALKAKYGEKADGVGRLPWLIQDSYARLLEAYKAGDKGKILTESDEVGGLVLDMHISLNLTENFDGQITGQHGLWVRLFDKLPQAMAHDLKLSPGAAKFLDDPKEYVFSMMVATYVWLDNVLYLEELARRGKPGYGDIYFEDLARKVGPILKERLAQAAEDAGSYWYTAWTVAGRPEMK
jgi:hypothetical protein